MFLWYVHVTEQNHLTHSLELLEFLVAFESLFHACNRQATQAGAGSAGLAGAGLRRPKKVRALFRRPCRAQDETIFSKTKRLPLEDRRVSTRLRTAVGVKAPARQIERCGETRDEIAAHSRIVCAFDPAPIIRDRHAYDRTWPLRTVPSRVSKLSLVSLLSSSDCIAAAISARSTSTAASCNTFQTKLDTKAQTLSTGRSHASAAAKMSAALSASRRLTSSASQFAIRSATWKRIAARSSSSKAGTLSRFAVSLVFSFFRFPFFSSLSSLTASAAEPV